MRRRKDKDPPFSATRRMPSEVPLASPPGTPLVPDRTLLRRAKRLIRIVFAFTLLVIGAILVPVPLVAGWPIILVALSILAVEYVWARRLMNRIKRGAVRVKDAALWRPRQRQPPPPAPPEVLRDLERK